MEIEVPESFSKEFKEQFIGDTEYDGFNKGELLSEWLKEELFMATGKLRLK